jgi:hypothetical protein
MHRLISGTPAGMETDHIDGDGLNNRRSNLRFATTSENQRNRVASANNTSGGRKGVNFHRYSGRWRASIQLNGKRRHLGYFDTPDQAHAAYCESAVRLHGDFVHESIRCHAASDQKKAHRQVAARSRPSPPHTNTEPARMPAEDWAMRTGDILHWIVVDARTGEPIIRCASRAEARAIARDCDGRVAKVVLTK